MIYLRARYYDPSIGRFTSYDIEEGKISNPLDMNRYVYCRNNPVRYADPSGRAAIAVSAGVITAIKYGTAILGGVAIGNGITYFAKKSKTNKKERATEIPSWAKGQEPKAGENGKDYAKRLCDERYGKGNYNTGPNSDYNKLKKHGDRKGK